jgi:hypothetical protein
MTTRDDRSIRFFGEVGQDRLRSASVSIVGVGGLGTHVVQQLALLGVGQLTLIDHELLEETNLNRYIGARPQDVGMPKTEIGRRIALTCRPEIKVHVVPAKLQTHEAFDALRKSAFIFGCLDNEGARLVLTEFCAVYDVRYADLATEILPGSTLEYGGRVFVSWAQSGCLVCLGALDLDEAASDLASPESRRDREDIYGVPSDAITGAGPAVVSLNGVIASLGVTEFMLGLTGIRNPQSFLVYRGSRGVVSVNADAPSPDCYYCDHVRGSGDGASLNRYVAES